ncbi:Uncharacterized conserved protein YegL, contains vWA domain of TerY type [Clostridium cavendishii DSM 21758]|uniref:Uncharacterized conserved protein YegL, contains vWA domain of TerY type n=1 Tax=Clostridium cavendishii DSM 21758 TaxID=1121302 RepID=A0A1M6FMR4_9CLOT|nr:VWA domain-containing protein [Clostridium cavendishii]SHI98977.1 Uncharacterized conserved protein YegL, contains vWA domain of TerY type [Clostridium cavendishii DSM 21758]
MNLNELREQDLYDNPTPRVPVCLVLDTSGSMMGEPIDELNKGVALFFKSIKDDPIAKYAAEISIINFGGAIANKVLDFTTVEKQKVPTLEAHGLTPMGSAITMALDILERRKEEYSEAGVEYFQPWLVIMTDGIPTDSIEEVIQRTVKLVNNRKLTVFPIGIGDEADMDILSKFSPGNAPAKLKDLDFTALFEWLSQSVIDTSKSMAGESINLKDPSTWMELDL